MGCTSDRRTRAVVIPDELHYPNRGSPHLHISIMDICWLFFVQITHSEFNNATICDGVWRRSLANPAIVFHIESNRHHNCRPLGTQIFTCDRFHFHRHRHVQTCQSFTQLFSHGGQNRVVVDIRQFNSGHHSVNQIGNIRIWARVFM